MFTVWTIGNFKSIRDPITLDLAPLTIFSGINSSGKSTLIQSILMVAQSFISVVDDEALILNGRFLQLGRLQDILHFGCEMDPIQVGFDWIPTDDLITPDSLVIHVEAKINREPPRRSQGKRSDKSHPYLSEAKFAFGLIRHYQQGEKKLSMQVMEVQSSETEPLPGMNQLAADLRAHLEDKEFSYVLTKPPSSKLIQDARVELAQRIALSNIIPSRLLVSVDVDLARLIDDTEWILNVLAQVSDPSRPNPREVKDMPLSPRLSDVFKKIRLPEASVSRFKEQQTQSMSDFRHAIITSGGKLSRGWVLRQLTSRIYPPSGMNIFRERLAAALSEYLRENPPLPPGKTVTSYEERLLPPEYMLPINLVKSIFREKIYYLGPLREDPRVIYAQPPLSEQWSVGIKGEYTAAMLDEYRNMFVDYPVPPEIHSSGRYIFKRGKLIEAVTLWLQRMGLVDSVDTRETPKVGYRLIVNSPNLDMPLDLTSVGVGVSQVLPTLVMALLAPLDSILIFEQPELHLHPKVQSVLGDFFLAVSQMGKQCLVETHSEHLINRLRRRIVESEQNTVLPKLRIYFARKEGAVSHFQEVKPNEFGTILEWPEGFFDEAENEASVILKLQMAKRREAREKRKQQQEGA